MLANHQDKRDGQEQRALHDSIGSRMQTFSEIPRTKNRKSQKSPREAPKDRNLKSHTPERKGHANDAVELVQGKSSCSDFKRKNLT